MAYFKKKESKKRNIQSAVRPEKRVPILEQQQQKGKQQVRGFTPGGPGNAKNNSNILHQENPEVNLKQEKRNPSANPFSHYSG